MSDIEKLTEPELYYFPDEGMVASVVVDGDKRFYTRVGLEHLILQGRQRNHDTRVYERALDMIHQVSVPVIRANNIYQFELPLEHTTELDEAV
jgi:hypothetical protein